MIIYIAIILCFLAIHLYRNFGKTKSVISKWKKIPLEKGLPIIGVVNKIEKPLCNYLLKLSKKHGPIYQVQFGMRKVVVLNTFEYIKAALEDNAEALAGRWKAQSYLFSSNNAGLFFSEGHVLTEQRSFVLKVLREFGVGRSRSVEIIQDECVHLLEDLEKLKGQSVDLTDFLQIYTLNMVTQFVTNKRLFNGSPEFKALKTFMSVAVAEDDPVSNFLLMFPFLENHEWIMKVLMWITSRKSLADNLHHLIEEEIKEHSSKLDLKLQGEDLIDIFLIKQRRMKEKYGSVGTFTDWQLIKIVFDLFMGGIDTTSTTLVWGFMLMARYPKVQNKVHEEIVDKIGKERIPIMGDKKCLTYTQAVIDEVFRLASSGPLADPHRVLSDVDVKGFMIPADTIVFPNIFACHHDPNVWDKPLEFYPEHFLSTDSHGELKYHPREELIIFSMGKRICIAESLARIQFFICFTSIMQRFQVKMVTEKSHFDVLSGRGGILRKPDIEEFIFKKRL